MTESAPKPHILVVDDDEGIRFVFNDLLKNLGYAVTLASDGQEALNLLEKASFDLVLLDLMLPLVDGMDVLRQARKARPDQMVLIITGEGSPEKAMEAIREGAYDYFTKPFEVHAVRVTIQRALEKKQLVDQVRELENRIAESGTFKEIIGSSAAMGEVFSMMNRVVDNDVPVLILGESGTGKEMVAQAIHSRSNRSQGPLIKVNCAAIPEPLLESELFGHEKGSFTGAVAAHAGKFEQAHAGTLFLDEIGEMPLALQAKILRAVQESEVERLGGKQTRQVDVRLLTATNKNLAAEVAAKRFREDLYFRINVVALELPPLRERVTDIPLLVQFFIERYKRDLGKMVEGVSPEVMDRFLGYNWPGNVRELENTIQRALVMATGSHIQTPDLPPTLRGEEAPAIPVPAASGENGTGTLDFDVPLPQHVKKAAETLEKRYIEAAMERTSNQEEMARLLGISRRSLQYKMKEYKIS